MKIGSLFIALSAIVFGSIGVTTQGIFAVSATNPFSVTWWRALIALPVLALITALLLRRRLFVIARRDLVIMLAAGLMMSIYQAGFVIALRNVNVTIATLVALGMVPVLAAVFSGLLLHERVHRQVYLAIACALAGLVLLVGLQPGENLGSNVLLGVAFSLLTALGSALFQICGRVLANRYHPLQALTVFVLVSAILLFPPAVANGFVTSYPPVGWLLLLHLGVGISVIGYLFLILGLQTTPATVATIIALLEPLTGSILAWLLLGERLSTGGLLGAGLLLVAMVIVLRANTRPPVVVSDY
jgi:DME family drug/metabolite transporter